MISIAPFVVLALFGIVALYIQAKMILRLARLLDKAQDHIKEMSDRSYNLGMSALPARTEMPDFVPWGDGSGAGFYKQGDGSYIPLGPNGERMPNPLDGRAGRATVADNEGDAGFDMEQER